MCWKILERTLQIVLAIYYLFMRILIEFQINNVSLIRLNRSS